VNSFPKTVTRQRRGCDLNPGPTAPESSTLTTRLLSHPSGHTERNTHQIDCSAWTTNVVDCDTCVSQPARISICFDVVSWLGVDDDTLSSKVMYQLSQNFDAVTLNFDLYTQCHKNVHLLFFE